MVHLFKLTDLRATSAYSNVNKYTTFLWAFFEYLHMRLGPYYINIICCLNVTSILKSIYVASVNTMSKI